MAKKQKTLDIRKVAESLPKTKDTLQARADVAVVIAERLRQKLNAKIETLQWERKKLKADMEVVVEKALDVVQTELEKKELKAVKTIKAAMKKLGFKDEDKDKKFVRFNGDYKPELVVDLRMFSGSEGGYWARPSGVAFYFKKKLKLSKEAKNLLDERQKLRKKDDEKYQEINHLEGKILKIKNVRQTTEAIIAEETLKLTPEGREMLKQVEERVAQMLGI